MSGQVTGSSLLCKSFESPGKYYWQGALSGSCSTGDDNFAVSTRISFDGSGLKTVVFDVRYDVPGLLATKLNLSSSIGACSSLPAKTTGAGSVSLTVPSDESALVFDVKASYNKCAQQGADLLEVSGNLEKARTSVFGVMFDAEMTLSATARRDVGSGALLFSGGASGTLRSVISSEASWFSVAMSMTLVDNKLEELSTIAHVDLNLNDVLVITAKVAFSTAECGEGAQQSESRSTDGGR